MKRIIVTLPHKTVEIDEIVEIYLPTLKGKHSTILFTRNRISSNINHSLRNTCNTGKHIFHGVDRGSFHNFAEMKDAYEEKSL